MRLFRCVATILGAILLASCGSGTTQSTSEHPRPEQLKIKLGVLPVLGAAPVFLANEKGFFAQEGISVEFVTIQGAGAAVPAMVNGDLDLVFGNYVSFFTAQAKQTADVKFVADGYTAKPRTWMVLVAKGSPYRGAADLSGKRVAVTTTNSLADLTVKSALNNTGSQVALPKFVEMPYTDMAQALQNKTVDAALLAEPYITDAEKKSGSWPLFDAAEGPTADIPISGYATTAKYAKDNPNTVAAFQRALHRGAEIASTDREQVEQSIRGYASVDEQTAALVTLPGYPTSLDPSRLQRVPDLMSSYGMLSTKIDVRSMIMPNALKLSP
jgi:NitT/TauT family transport system substrate-binding protein